MQPAIAAKWVLKIISFDIAMSPKGQSLPMHFFSPVPNNVRYAPDSDRSRHEAKLTLCGRRQHIVVAQKLAEVRNELVETVELIDALMGDGNLTR